MSVRVAVDAMGGDNAPKEIVRGACLAAKLNQEAEIVLVGDKDRIEEHIPSETPRDKLEILHTTEVIGMDESPISALRGKRDSSINKAIDILADGSCQAFVSAGNSGAVVAAACLYLKMIPGVSKPGICVTFPTEKGPCCLTDCGANVNCRPADLYNYAVMTSIYASEIIGIENPTVGLMSVGEEASKGNTLVIETHDLLKNSHLNFIGNVEGREVHLHKCDVIICDGFTGNVVLKVSEGLAEMYLSVLSNKITKDMFRNLPELTKVIREMVSLRDYSEYGGAPLLGVNGSVIIGHGRSGAKAILNAVNMAVTSAGKHIDDRYVEALDAQAAN